MWNNVNINTLPSIAQQRKRSSVINDNGGLLDAVESRHRPPDAPPPCRPRPSGEWGQAAGRPVSDVIRLGHAQAASMMDLK
jgi:hypothetical protein